MQNKTMKTLRAPSASPELSDSDIDSPNANRFLKIRHNTATSPLLSAEKSDDDDDDDDDVNAMCDHEKPHTIEEFKTSDEITKANTPTKQKPYCPRRRILSSMAAFNRTSLDFVDADGFEDVNDYADSGAVKLLEFRNSNFEEHSQNEPSLETIIVQKVDSPSNACLERPVMTIHNNNVSSISLSQESHLKSKPVSSTHKNSKCFSQERCQQRTKRCMSCCKKSIAFFFSHIGLCCVVVMYALAGGLLFQKLEKDAEIDRIKTYAKLMDGNHDDFIKTMERKHHKILMNLSSTVLDFAITLRKTCGDTSNEYKKQLQNMASTIEHIRSVITNYIAANQNKLQLISTALDKFESSLNNSQTITNNFDNVDAKCTKENLKLDCASILKTNNTVKLITIIRNESQIIGQNIKSFENSMDEQLNKTKNLKQQKNKLEGKLLDLQKYQITEVKKWKNASKTTISDLVHNLTDKYTLEVYNATQNGWKPSHSNNGIHDRARKKTDNLWTLPGSLLYSITIITTIGYGHISPKTDIGRIMTVMYAMIGIPLMLLCLTNLGGFMADVFRVAYKYSCLRFCRYRRRVRRLQKQKQKLKKQREAFEQANYPFENTAAREDLLNKGNDVDKNPNNNLTLVNRMLSSIEESNDEQVIEAPINVSPIVQNSQPAKSIDNVTLRSKDKETDKIVEPRKNNSFSFRQSFRFHPTNGRPPSRLMMMSITSVKAVRDKSKHVRVPIWLTLLFLALYIFLGAFAFAVWESWSFMDSAYFCFITLSTIGFGDLVPGSKDNEWKDEVKPILCCFYLLFGLSTISMSFQLMQDEVRFKIKKFARNIGLIEEEDAY